MFSFSETLGASSFNDIQMLIMICTGFGIVLLTFGAVGVYGMRDRSAMRIRALAESMAAGQGAAPAGAGLTRFHEEAPRGWKKALIPEDPSERAQIRFQLAKVGFERPDSVELFFLIRLCLALLVPVGLLATIALARGDMLPQTWADAIGTTSGLRYLQIGAVGAAVGFYGPGYWLNARIAERKAKITAAFPNALDLVQISVEAGMGFDAAINRVGHELGRVAPEVAYEFLLLQLEIQAGRDREAALMDMAERMGIDEAKSFALVIIQSLQFGTSLTVALKTYAAEMREMRELSAQEKANRLPVQMSAVMSLLMLPALFLITLTPIIIRYAEIY